MSIDDKREAILQSALKLVAEQGFHGAPMAMVAQQAGVAAGTIYRYFENKDVMIRAVYSCLEEQVWSTIKVGFPEEAPIRERFLHICRKLIFYFLAFPTEFRFVEQFHNSPYGVACRREKFFENVDKDLVADLFDQGQKQQIIKELPRPILCALTFGPIVDACRDHILQFIHLDELLIERISEACWDAVKR